MENNNQENKPLEKKKFKLLKLSKKDKLGIILLVLFVSFWYIILNVPKGTCEVARPNYKCLPAKTVMIEHCVYWGKYNCNTSADNSLPQVEWYIENLCEIHNKYHSDKLDCSNLKLACNQVTGNQTCPVGI